MGAKGAAEIIFKGKDIEKNSKEYEAKFANPLSAAKRGFIDEIITPTSTRLRIIEELQVLSNKNASRPQRHHGNLPL